MGTIVLVLWSRDGDGGCAYGIFDICINVELMIIPSNLGGPGDGWRG